MVEAYSHSPLPFYGEVSQTANNLIVHTFKYVFSTESGLLIEVAIFFPTNVAFLSSLWTKLVEIWYTFNMT